MDINKLLQDQGWNISPKGLSIINENGSLNDLNSVVRNALNSDLKEIGSAVLANELKKDNIVKIVLQVQKVRNVSAPKANQESQAAPRMARIILTDGHTTCQAVELSEIAKLSLNNTPPGTKFLVKGAKISSGFILLDRNSCTVLGGIVPSLFDKWDITKNIDIERRSSNVDGPPPWVNFGEKIVSSESNAEFKSLESKTTKEASKEFEEQRQGAIAEVSMGAVRKVFGGGIKANNILNKEQQSGYPKENRWESRNKEHERDGRGNRGRRDKELKEKPEKLQSKPPEKVSLFDFLETKLQINDTGNNFNSTNTRSTTDASSKTETSNYSNQQNKMYPPKSGNQRPPRFQQSQRQTNYGSYENRKTKPQNFRQNEEQTQYKIEKEWYRRDKEVPAKNLQEKSSQQSNNLMQFDERLSQGNKKMDTNKDSGSKKAETNKDENNLVGKMEKMSLNGQYATSILKQHLNSIAAQGSMSNSPRTNQKQGNWHWKIGDHCMAKYWEDRKYYNATIINLTDRTCVVQFNGYGNIEEVLKSDCIPLTDVQQESHLYNSRPVDQGAAEVRKSSQSFSNRRT